MNKQPRWVPEQPTEIAVAEAAFGAVAVRAMIDEGMVDLHWLEDGSCVLDWSDLMCAVPVWQKWASKSRSARRAAVDVVAHEQWLACLLQEHEEQVRAKVKAEANAARRTAIQRNYHAERPAEATADSAPMLTMDELLAEL